MKKIDLILKAEPFSLKENYKKKIFKELLENLTLHHYKKCNVYKKIINNLKFRINNKNKLEDYPMLPVRTFKDFELRSIKKNKIVKVLLSSGTSSQKVSKIFLDKENAINQMKTLTNIIETVLGKERLPMLIIDRKPNLNNKSDFNARAAAIIGFSLFGKNNCYLLNNNNKININH